MEEEIKYRDKDWLYQKYWKEKLSSTEMGKLQKVYPSTIIKWMEKYGIPRRNAVDCIVGKYSGDKSFNWKGGRVETKRGYVLVCSPNHPYKTKTGRGEYVYEHRLVMEKHIGRYLHPWETVHHINGIRGDNRIENLQLLQEKNTTSRFKKCIKKIYF